MGGRLVFTGLRVVTLAMSSFQVFFRQDFNKTSYLSLSAPPAGHHGAYILSRIFLERCSFNNRVRNHSVVALCFEKLGQQAACVFS